jgi:hypothetical protein
MACGRAGVRACGRAGVRACGRAGVRAEVCSEIWIAVCVKRLPLILDTCTMNRKEMSIEITRNS